MARIGFQHLPGKVGPIGMRTTWADLQDAAEGEGLALRGGFHCQGEVAATIPCDESGRSASSLVLLGNVGGSLWQYFSKSPEYGDGRADPLDRWSHRIIDGLARKFTAKALFPSDGPPYLPFQRWAQIAEGLSPSPLGSLIHPRYGLWHAYRGALVFADRVEGLPTVAKAEHPCLTCTQKPCLTACPVAAFNADGYDAARCVSHISKPEGEDCMLNSCIARRAWT